MDVTITINGIDHSADIEPRMLLIDFIRYEVGLTGSHIGCDTTSCGVCTVLVDGTPVKSCTMFAVQADGADLMTVEGLAKPDGALHPIQDAFAEEHGLQCGFCTPGFLMSVCELLQQNANPSDEEIKDVLGGQICRCTGYQSILRSVGAPVLVTVIVSSIRIPPIG